MNKNVKDYFVGLDIGTNSIGWSVANENYNVLNYNNKKMWGVRRFEAGETAESRRLHRGARRRLKRRKERLSILQDFFEPHINEIDPTFFTRRQESRLHLEDKSTDYTFVNFIGDTFTDQDYGQKFPTIFHLREALIKNTAPQDIRLVYIALHHILKYRGHFLINGDISEVHDIDEVMTQFNDMLDLIYGFRIYNMEDFDEVKTVLKDTSLTRTEKSRALNKWLQPELDKSQEKIAKQINRLISGLNVRFSLLLPDIEMESSNASVNFSKENYEEELQQHTELTEEHLLFLEYAKAIFDWAILEELLKNEKYISSAHVQSYKLHGEQLTALKKLVKDKLPNEYDAIFRDPTVKDNYVHYINKGESKVATTESFYKFLKQKFKLIKNASKEIETIEAQMDLENCLPKQRISTNGVIPHQLHEIELRRILANAETYLPFLTNTDEQGLTVSEKIRQLFKFRIPYYVGPLNDYHAEKDGFAWVIRKKDTKVYPWNFEEVIDVKASAKQFIERMTNSCTYLPEYKVIPRSSLLYQKFMVLNELNNVRVNNELLDILDKQAIYEDLFVKQNINVTENTIRQWYEKRHAVPQKEITISGMDGSIKGRLTTHHDMQKILGAGYDYRMVEDIVSWITLFNDAKDILKHNILEVYGDYLTERQLKQLLNLTYIGWGNLSREFLEEVLDTRTFAEPISIIQALYLTDQNLMELLSQSYAFSQEIEKINRHHHKEVKRASYDMVEDLYVSPAVRRSIWQTLRLLDEIVTVRKGAPEKIFLEVARETGQKNQRTLSRKDRLIALYKNIKSDQALLDKLTEQSDSQLRSKKLYLYFTQRGRCMYSGDIIDFNALFDNNVYDIDHIYPRSITKDDSFTNLVLVKRELNVIKADDYPVPVEFQKKASGLWKSLLKTGFIEKEKYERLTRKDELTPEELSGFINRQLVETRQSTKAIANLLKQIYPDTQIVYVKANLTTDFRYKFAREQCRNPECQQSNCRDQACRQSEPTFYKVREVNDLHHAYDAYLNIVVGNVYHTQFTSNPYNFIKNAPKRSYNLAKLYDREVSRNGRIAWRPGWNGTIKNVTKMMRRHDILTTWLQTDGSGELFDATIQPQGKGQVPIKAGLSIDKYGGYNKASVSHYVLIEGTRGKQRYRFLKSIPIYVAQSAESISDIMDYLVTVENVKDPTILIPHIHASNALFEYDGIRARITGKTGKSYVVRNEIQPTFSPRFNETIQALNYINRNNIPIEKSKITEAELIELFDELIAKLDSPIYQPLLGNSPNPLYQGRDKFLGLALEDKVEVIYTSLNMIRSTREFADLRLIGGVKSAGNYTLGENLSNRDYVYLIHQSVTGLYETKVDVLAL